MIRRLQLEKAVRNALKRSPVTAILGPRQCGKTTLARALCDEQKAEFFDLESDLDVNRLANPLLTLEALRGVVVIDEIQRRPDLFRILRVLADRKPLPARFLILGSASPELVRGASESLAGRVEFVDMAGFTLQEVGMKRHETLWTRGGMPRSYLAGDATASMVWRRDFMRTFLERDIPQLGISIPAETLRRFWGMIAHYNAQTWNSSEIGRSFGLSDKTVHGYLDILCGTFMVRRLPAWFENVGKRQVKAPKVYVRDSGILHALLGLGSTKEVMAHPKCGASWEGFALEQILAFHSRCDAYFWKTHSGPELDLLILEGGRRVGYEFKHADAPSLTPSMTAAMGILELDRLWVVYPGTKSYPLADGIAVIPLGETAPPKARRPSSA